MATAGIWDILNPELITVPTPDPDITHPIRCLTLVNNRLWIGTGPFLAFLEMDSLFHEVLIVYIMGCKFVVYIGCVYDTPCDFVRHMASSVCVFVCT